MDDRPADAIPNPARMEELLQELMRGINRMFLDAIGGQSVVAHGPFKGMVIPNAEEESWTDGNFSTKILGIYEHELHDAIGYAIARHPRTIVNVGCGDGYYAIGLARLVPHAMVYAFDVSEPARLTCVEVIRRNKLLGHVQVGDGCREARELAIGDGKALYVMDCEGDELALLDMDGCPDLARSDIIVECHDFLDKDCSMKLANRFAKTHAIEIIRPRLPLFGRFEFLNKTPGITQVLMTTEKRPMPTLWLACWANQRGD